MKDFAERSAAYLRHKMPEATELTVVSVSRIFGGASCETYRLRAQWQIDGKVVERAMIFRRDSPGAIVKTSRALEYETYKALCDGSFPVPEAIYLETDETWLERPFFVMEEVLNCSQGYDTIKPYGEFATEIGTQFYTHLGFLSTLKPESLTDLYALLEPVAPTEAWRQQLDRWEKVIEENARANPPPPAEKISLVHGDYRAGNFLFDVHGKITAILDWEMVHLGDPLEDLAWSMDAFWCNNSPLVGYMVLPEEAIRIWEQASGLRADPTALKWWQLLNQVKGIAIWISAGTEYEAKRNTNPVIAYTAWAPQDLHNKALAQSLVAQYTNQQRRASA